MGIITGLIVGIGVCATLYLGKGQLSNGAQWIADFASNFFRNFNFFGGNPGHRPGYSEEAGKYELGKVKFKPISPSGEVGPEKPNPLPDLPEKDGFAKQLRDIVAPISPHLDIDPAKPAPSAKEQIEQIKAAELQLRMEAGDFHRRLIQQVSPDVQARLRAAASEREPLFSPKPDPEPQDANDSERNTQILEQSSQGSHLSRVVSKASRSIKSLFPTFEREESGGMPPILKEAAKFAEGAEGDELKEEQP